MKIFVKAKPNSKIESIKKLSLPPHSLHECGGGAHFEICVKEPPVKGQANAAIIMALAKHFKVPFSAVRIISGHISRQKIVEVNL